MDGDCIRRVQFFFFYKNMQNLAKDFLISGFQVILLFKLWGGNLNLKFLIKKGFLKNKIAW